MEWAQEAIDHLACRNVLNGFEDGSFRPQEKVSREQLVTMLLMNFYPNFEAAPASFADVPEQAWFAPFVGAAEQMGITGGIGEGLFGAGTPISRQDMAVLADKIALKAGIVMNPRPDLARIVFADADAISAYAVGSVERLRAAGIVAGKPDGRFAPQDSCTRAEAAVIIYGLIKE